MTPAGERTPLPAVVSLLMAEWRKQSRLKLPYIGLVTLSIMAAMWPHLMSNYTDLPATEPTTGYEFVASAIISINTSLLPIFAAIFAATLVAGETSSGTIRYVLLRPISRVSFLAAKFLAAFAYTCLLLAVTALAVIAVGAATIGFASARDLLIGVDLPAGQYWSTLALALLLALPAACATAAYGACLSVVFRNVGAAVGVAAGALVTMETVSHRLVFGDFRVRDWLWTDYFAESLEVASRLAQGTPLPWLTPALVFSLIVPLAWIAVFAAISLVITLRRDWGS